MNAFWSYFVPAFVVGLVAGIVAATIAYRDARRRNAVLALGFVAALILAAAWHGPIGGADRFAGGVERNIRQALVENEMTQASGHLLRHPLSRHVLLSGPADDFQRNGLVELMNLVPGVSGASWTDHGGNVPLIVEGAGAALLGFLLGAVLAYLAELRRRYNMQWDW